MFWACPHPKQETCWSWSLPNIKFFSWSENLFNWVLGVKRTHMQNCEFSFLLNQSSRDYPFTDPSILTSMLRSVKRLCPYWQHGPAWDPQWPKKITWISLSVASTEVSLKVKCILWFHRILVVFYDHKCSHHATTIW